NNPNRRTANVAGGEPSTDEVVLNLGSRPIFQFVNVPTFASGVPVTAFVDTGATISVMSAKLAKKLRLKPVPGSAIFIRQLDGRTRSVGRVSLPLRIQSITKTVTVHIVENFDYPFLLGLDIGKLFELNIDLSKMRSEERRVGKECRSQGGPDQ